MSDTLTLSFLYPSPSSPFLALWKIKPTTKNKKLDYTAAISLYVSYHGDGYSTLSVNVIAVHSFLYREHFL